jgi:FkbM family methyltransferase
MGVSVNPASSIGERIRRIARGALPRPVYASGAAFLDSFYGVQRFGVEGYRKLSAVRNGPLGSEAAPLDLRPLEHPFYVRPGTPDAGVVLHAIAREAYSYMLPAEPVQFIIDAGANIGDTSAWYASRFPGASVLAIEPNPENLAVLLRNCAPYGERIRVLQAALWPTPDKELEMAGTYTGIHVQEAAGAGGLTCPSIDPMSILRDSGREWIDIFKIDIEGAELALFGGNCDPWLGKTRSIAIEIHSPEAREAVLAATRRNGFKHAIYRDLNVFWR